MTKMWLSPFCLLQIYLFLECASAIEEPCMELKSPNHDGTRVNLHIYLEKMVLPQFYSGRGPCGIIIHADSVRVNGVCNELDFHTHDVNAQQRCKLKFPRDHLKFKKCWWNRHTVKSGGFVNTERATVGSNVIVQFYDQKRCVDFKSAMSIKVKGVKDAAADDLKTCMSAGKAFRSSPVRLLIFLQKRVLPELYSGSGTCGKLAYTRSALVNGKCMEVSFLNNYMEEVRRCERTTRRGTLPFRQCVWNSRTMQSTRYISIPTVLRGNAFHIRFFRSITCTDSLLAGSLIAS